MHSSSMAGQEGVNLPAEAAGVRLDEGNAELMHPALGVADGTLTYKADVLAKGCGGLLAMLGRHRHHGVGSEGARTSIRRKL